MMPSTSKALLDSWKIRYGMKVVSATKDGLKVDEDST
jgi:hypothetical protein